MPDRIEDPQTRLIKGRGAIAVSDMKNRLAAGWTFEQLWERLRDPNARYDYADPIVIEPPKFPPDPNGDAIVRVWRKTNQGD